MPTNEANPASTSTNRKVWYLTAAGLATFLIVLVIVLQPTFLFLASKGIAHLLSDYISRQTGWSIWMARIVAAVAAAVLLPTLWLLLTPAFTDTRRIRRRRAKHLLLACSVGVFLVMYFASAEHLYGRYYRYDPLLDEVVIGDHDGIDLSSGQAWTRIDTPELAQEIRFFLSFQEQKRAGGFQVIPRTLFDQDHQALYRFYRDKEGWLTLFPRFQRVHPLTNESLGLISSAEARELLEQEQLGDGYFRKFFIYDVVEGTIKVSAKGGKDPVTMQDWQPISSPELAREIRMFLARRLDGELPSILFDQNGDPLYRYYEESGGRIALFPRFLRIHPVNGADLKLITPEIASRLSEQEKDDKHGAEIEPVHPEPHMPKERESPSGSPGGPSDSGEDPRTGEAIQPKEQVQPGILLDVREVISGSEPTSKQSRLRDIIVDRYLGLGYQIQEKPEREDEPKPNNQECVLIVRALLGCDVTDFEARARETDQPRYLIESSRGIYSAKAQIRIEFLDPITKRQLDGNTIYGEESSPSTRADAVAAALNDVVKRINAESLRPIDEILRRAKVQR